jgi:hypothetical protein
MRNEIYSRIRQNKMKYYAELNNLNQQQKPISVVSEKKEEVVMAVREKQPREKSVLLKKVQEFDYKSLFKKVPEAVKTGYQGTVKSKAMNALKNQVKNDHEKIRQFSAKVNRKIDRQTDRLANGVYNVSSFLFEDQHEDNSRSKYTAGALVIETVGSNIVEWGVDALSQPSVSVYDKIGNYSETAFDWLRSLPGKFVNFITTDDLPDTQFMDLKSMK